MAKRILIVDDELDVLELVAFRLEKAGYGIITAVDGQEGLDSIRAERPDLVLLDSCLPGMDAFEVCKELKNDEGLKHMPIILFTATLDITVAEKAKELGANDFILKPFDSEELLKKVKRIIG